ncbi:MAG: hypothetical protein IPP48_15080 [Chitinophagaceae bacterium]|nr:hypothetical protein [Chitinophagaceae bacterium]
MKKIYYSILTGVLCVFISLTSKSQVTVAGSTGANGTYPSLTLAGGAFAAINAAGTQAGNNITVSITADLLTETGANPLNASDWTTLTISPSGGAIRNVQGNVNGPLIDLNGADNVTIDGLNTGGNALNIDNQNGVSASTIRFINDASNNTLIRCNILGASGITAGPALGTIYFAGGTTTGNDNNAISQCILSASVTGTPQNAIYSLGTSAAVDNSNNTIFACLINDFLIPQILLPV